jgi:gamma-glutamyltranspeptidase/glutathione hydrolase
MQRMSRWLASLSTLVLLLAAPASPGERAYGRSMVVTLYGIVATAYVQASQAGAQVLEQGGSAVDAGIASAEPEAPPTRDRIQE